MNEINRHKPRFVLRTEDFGCMAGTVQGKAMGDASNDSLTMY